MTLKPSDRLVVQDFRSIPNSLVHDLDEWVNHQDKEQGRERIALYDAVREAYFSDTLLRPIREADLPPRHHLDDEHLSSWMESVHIQEFFQKGVIHVIVRLLEVVIKFDNFFLLFLLHHIQCHILQHCFLASLGGSDPPLLILEDASSNTPEEPYTHQFMDCECDHLHDGGEAGNWR